MLTRNHFHNRLQPEWYWSGIRGRSLFIRTSTIALKSRPIRAKKIVCSSVVGDIVVSQRFILCVRGTHYLVLTTSENKLQFSVAHNLRN